MQNIKTKRLLLSAGLVVACFLLQCMLFPRLPFTVNPNLLLVVTASCGFMRGPKEGMLVGFFAGLLVDIQFESIIGFYALLYLLIGYGNGLFESKYYHDDIKLPMAMVAGSEGVYSLVVYVFWFLLRSKFHILYYLGHIIIPELIYTIVVTAGLYPLIRILNYRLDEKEKRSAK